MAVQQDGHLTMDRGPAVEHLRNVQQGLHQSWRFEAAPPGTGDLVLRLRITGAVHTGQVRGGHMFREPVTGRSVRYGAATWIDARGRRTAMTVRHLGGGVLVLKVPAAVVDSSAYPAEIDPVVSVPTGLNKVTLGYADASQMRPVVASDGLDFLVLWSDGRMMDGLKQKVMGTRVSHAGKVLDPGGIYIWADKVMGSTAVPAVAYDGTNYLVVIVENTGGKLLSKRVSPKGKVLDGGMGNLLAKTSNHVDEADLARGTSASLLVWATHDPGKAMGLLLDGSGKGIGSPFTIASPSNKLKRPRVSHNGKNYLVVFNQGTTYGRIAGVRVSDTGKVLDSKGIELAPWVTAGVPDVGSEKGSNNYLVVWNYKDTIVGKRVSASGAVLDSAELVLSAKVVGRLSRQPRVLSGLKEFRVIWARRDGYAATFDIYTSRVSAAGKLLDGTGVKLNPANGDLSWPGGSCSFFRCLVAWEDDTYYSHYDREIFGARVSAGTVLDKSQSLHLSAAASEQQKAAVAYRAGHYLVVWQDRWTGPYFDVYAARVDLKGKVLDPAGIKICDAQLDQVSPRVAASASGWLVVWEDHRVGAKYSYHEAYGARVSAAGAALDPGGFKISATNKAYHPALASDGTDYLVAWSAYSDVRARRISAAGKFLDAKYLTLSKHGAWISVASGGGQYLVAYNSSWRNYAVRITPAGKVLDPQPGIEVNAGKWPSATHDGDNFVVAGRCSISSSLYGMCAVRVSNKGVVLDKTPIQLAAKGISGYQSAWYREGPEASFDGVDTVVVWGSNFRGTTVYAAWMTPLGQVFGQSVLAKPTAGVPLSPSIAGQGDGNHSLLVYSKGDLSSGVGNFRVTGSIVTFKINGQPCSVNAECKSGYCVDSMCCKTACVGPPGDCMACSVAAGAAKDGLCGPVKAGKPCRKAKGDCDLAETCDGTNVHCPKDQFKAKSVECRAAAGVCDQAESCTGKSSSCPPDALKSKAVECRAAAGPCDAAETCDGSSTACPADELKKAGAVCRAAAGGCDVAESCDGKTNTCPADKLEASGTPCRAKAGDCDVAESCDGKAGLCPADAKLTAGTGCRASTGPCDVAESCDGKADSCPADEFKAAGTTCRASTGKCDPAESCDGKTGACSADKLEAAGKECRAAAGVCDAPETCDGKTGLCPVDKLAAAGTQCRAAAGDCDAAESCDGSSAACPVDKLRAPGTVCRAKAGDCDLEESCDGSSAVCPTDGFETQGKTCRAATGDCDVAEECSGTGAACPDDIVWASFKQCRASAGECDVAERCDGVGKSCPKDSLKADNTTCTGGVCVQGKCKTSSPDSGSPAPDRGSVPGPDAGVEPDTPDGGCSCAVGADGPGPALAVLFLVLVLRGQRRRGTARHA